MSTSVRRLLYRLIPVIGLSPQNTTPARTWTPENAVGIGGAYLCIYGMEGPGGYQFVGRTVPVWNRYKQTADFKDGNPWLLRFFDQIRFYPVSNTELTQLREDFIEGKFKLKIEETTFNLQDYQQFLHSIAEEATTFKTRQQAAFRAERDRWALNALDESTIADEPDLPQQQRSLFQRVAMPLPQQQPLACGKFWSNQAIVSPKTQAL
jgi:urea carboxylase